MKKVITVHHAIDRLEQLEGKLVEIEGVLNVEPDRLVLWHAPLAEGGAEYSRERPGYRVCIRLATGCAGMDFDDGPLCDWHERRVSVIGVLHGQDSDPQHEGRLGWSAKLDAYTVVLLGG